MGALRAQRIERFEDLVAWQQARELTAEIYAATRLTPFSQEYGLCRQIQRAAVSIMSNIAEGFEHGSWNEYCRFLAVAKASCGEVRSQLYVALDAGYLPRSRFDDLLRRAEEVSRIVSALRSSLLTATVREKGRG